MEKLYTVDDVAQMTGLTSRTIRNYLADGRLRGRKVGAQWRFTEENISAIFTDAEAKKASPAAANTDVAEYLKPQPRTCTSICAVIDYPAEDGETVAPLVQKLTDQLKQLGSDEVRFSYAFDEVNSVARFTIIGDISLGAKLIKTIRKE